MSLTKDAKESWPSMCSAMIAAFQGLVVKTIMSTGCKWQGTNLRSAGNILQMCLSTNEVPSNKLTARLSTTPNHTRVCRPPISGCNRTAPFELICSSFAILSFENFWCFMRDVQVGCRHNLLIRFRLASVSIKYSTWIISCNLLPTRTYVS